MRQRVIVFIWVAALMLGGAPVLSADDASFGKDLKATIALQGMPCDQVINAKRNADSDYTASCKDGNRYHVFVSPEGRVVVKKL
jgi:hypothetical protein